MEVSESLSCENNTSTLFSAAPDSSNMYLNKDSNLISDSLQDFHLQVVSVHISGIYHGTNMVNILQI